METVANSSNPAESSPSSVLPADFEARKIALHYAVQMGGSDTLDWAIKFRAFLTARVKPK